MQPCLLARLVGEKPLEVYTVRSFSFHDGEASVTCFMRVCVCMLVHLAVSKKKRQTFFISQFRRCNGSWLPPASEQSALKQFEKKYYRGGTYIFCNT